MHQKNLLPVVDCQHLLAEDRFDRRAGLVQPRFIDVDASPAVPERFGVLVQIRLHRLAVDFPEHLIKIIAADSLLFLRRARQLACHVVRQRHKHSIRLLAEMPVFKEIPGLCAVGVDQVRDRIAGHRHLMRGRPAQACRKGRCKTHAPGGVQIVGIRRVSALHVVISG